MKIEVPNTEAVAFLSDSDMRQIEEIMKAIISVGGCTGVRGGQTIIHFDHNGIFQRVELKYSPWIRRKN